MNGNITVCSGQKKNAHLTLCQGNPLITSGFPSQRASDVENLFISWRVENLFISWRLHGMESSLMGSSQEGPVEVTILCNITKVNSLIAFLCHSTKHRVQLLAEWGLGSDRAHEVFMPWYGINDKSVSTLPSNEHCGVSNYQFVQQLAQTVNNEKSLITGSLWGESTSDWWIPLTKGQ